LGFFPRGEAEQKNMTDTDFAASGGMVVIGGGISGITTAVEAAEAGHAVVLLEREPYLGGRVARMNEYFPKLCPPTCGLEINFKRMKGNPRVQVFTGARVTSVRGGPGAYTVEVDLAPRLVNERCTACDKCVPACPVERPDAFNYGVGTTKAVYLPHQMAYPMRYAIDEKACLGDSCARCVAYCPYDAIDLRAKRRALELHASAVVVATGWKPYEASRMENLGFGRLPNVITNVMLERLAARNGPTGGKILRPSDGRPVTRVAFVQCAGSRDEHHLRYCSTVCCTASFKQATYLRRQYPEAEIHIFYIDIRTMGILEDFFTKVKADDKLHLHRGKVAKIEAEAGDNLRVVAEDTLSGQRLERVVDLAVLATGMQPESEIGGVVAYDGHGFVNALKAPGITAAGCARRPVEVASAVQDATAAALKAIQALKGDLSGWKTADTRSSSESTH
jgi:heterodisulfide reductase subunit A-like polyferredoxin